MAVAETDVEEFDSPCCSRRRKNGCFPRCGFSPSFSEKRSDRAIELEVRCINAIISNSQSSSSDRCARPVDVSIRFTGVARYSGAAGTRFKTRYCRIDMSPAASA